MQPQYGGGGEERKRKRKERYAVLGETPCLRRVQDREAWPPCEGARSSTARHGTAQQSSQRGPEQPDST